MTDPTANQNPAEPLGGASENQAVPDHPTKGVGQGAEQTEDQRSADASRGKQRWTIWVCRTCGQVWDSPGVCRKGCAPLVEADGIDVVPVASAKAQEGALDRIANELPMGAFGTPIHQAQAIARAALDVTPADQREAIKEVESESPPVPDGLREALEELVEAADRSRFDKTLTEQEKIANDRRILKENE